MNRFLMILSAFFVLAFPASAQEVFEFNFPNQTTAAEIPGSRGAAFCALTLVDDDSSAGSCQVYRNNNLWMARSGGNAGQNNCTAACLFLPKPSQGVSRRQQLDSALERIGELERLVVDQRQENRRLKRILRRNGIAH